MGHRFSYRVMSLLIDLDRLDEADRQSPLFAVNRAALYSFSESDHGERDGSSLARLCAALRGRARHRPDRRAGAAAVLPPAVRLHLQSAVGLFLLSADGELALIIYEVRNTFGEIHPYVLPVQPGEISAAGVRQQQDKLFYVSPFIEMAMRYHFRVSPPGHSVKLRILETDSEGPLLSATFSGRRRSLTTAALLRSFFSLPLVTFKIVAAIHWEALRLWLKGMRLVPRENVAATKAGANTILASRRRNDYTRDRVVRSRTQVRSAEKRSGPVKVGSGINRPSTLD